MKMKIYPTESQKKFLCFVIGHSNIETTSYYADLIRRISQKKYYTEIDQRDLNMLHMAYINEYKIKNGLTT
jgi:hypothetical protein